MGRSKSSRRWLDEHAGDEHVQRARREGWRSRAIYKLQELDQRHRLLRPGLRVVDLGAAPGGWSQYAAQRIMPGGICVALDLLAIEPLPDVTTLQADFTENEGLAALEAVLGVQTRVDLVLSDMAPNISGVRATDQARAMLLAELAADFARERLADGGSFVVKLFQGEGFQELIADLRRSYRSVRLRKPEASRPRSREIYAVCTGFSYTGR